MPRRLTFLFLLWILAGIFSVPVEARAKTPKCASQYQKYEKALAEVGAKTQACAQDKDCELRFVGRLNGCDLGFAASKKTMGPAYFQKLERLRAAAEEACLAPEADRVQCAAEPAQGVRCVDKVCEPY